MRHFVFLVLFTFISACASHGKLQRVVHQVDGLLVTLDKGKVPASPAFDPPYDHPAEISVADLKRILETIQVNPREGMLMSIFSKKEPETLFTPKTAQLMAKQLSQALSKAKPTERVNFYQTQPRDSVKVAGTSGLLLVKDDRLHLRIDHFKVPLRKGFPLSSIGHGIKPSEKGRYAFTLSERDRMSHRTFDNLFGLTESDPHWLVIDYVDFPATPEATSPVPGIKPIEVIKTIEERLRTLKHLREESLITEEEYREKKQLLLKDL